MDYVRAKSAKLTRKEKVDLTRRTLHKTAAEIIGKDGFAAATLVRITTGAGIALGTFYNYFETRDDLFSDLVTEYGLLLRGYVRNSIPPNATFFVREEAAFRAWFRFLNRNPFFMRVLNEAEIFVPDAFEGYFQAIDTGYKRVLRAASKSGEIRKLSEAEIETVGLILMSSRIYYGLRLRHRMNVRGEMEDKIIDAYMTFVRAALAPILSKPALTKKKS